MKKVLDVVKTFGSKLPVVVKDVIVDLAKLKNKALATAVVAFLVSTLSPLGVNLGPNGGKILAVLSAVGVVAAIVEKLLVKK